jgi:plasmid replication initiation protein
LNSIHSIRLFELLQQFKSTGWRTVKIADLRELMGLPKGYERFNNLRAKILEPAVAELKAKSGLIIKMETVKAGRSVERITFHFWDDSQMSLGLT